MNTLINITSSTSSGTAVTCLCFTTPLPPMAQVRDFLFSPDDGRIMELRIDALGIPALPERLLGCLGVRIQLVHHIAYNCITLQPGAEAYIDKISPGAFDGAVELLKVRHSHGCLDFGV